jgi:tRNA pseudouridine55 synthase
LAGPSGVLPVDKPVGMTSHDVVDAVRRAAGERRVGHAGTLDPLATGLLLVCLGQATRISEYLAGHDKTYAVEARLGIETDTYDAEGTVVATYEGDLPGDEAIDQAVGSLVGHIEQMPPAYSAIKAGGKPLYWYARRGEKPAVQPRRVSIHSLTWRRLETSLLSLDVACSAGTYVRSLVHDLGHLLGCGAYVTGLRRLSSGPCEITEALPLAEAVDRLEARDWSALLGFREALSGMPTPVFDEDTVRRLSLGQRVACDVIGQAGPHLALDAGGTAFAIVEPGGQPGLWQPRKVLICREDPCPAG